MRCLVHFVGERRCEELRLGAPPLPLHRRFIILGAHVRALRLRRFRQTPARKDFPSLSILLDPPVTGYNLSPGRKLSVVVDRGSGARSCAESRLGSARREDQAAASSMCAPNGSPSIVSLRRSLRSHRCVAVPATTFVEWLDDSEPRRLLVA